MSERLLYDVIVVLPIGPGNAVDFVADTIQSYIHYARFTYKIIIADDSGEQMGEKISRIYPQCDIIVNKKPLGGWAGLYITLSNAYKHAVKNYTFKALLKLDTDALIIDDAPEQAALDLFAINPLAGIAGQYPFEYDGTPWNIKWPQQRIINSTRSWKFFRRPLANLQLIKQYKKAVQNGYRTGESVFGGAYFISSNCLTSLYKNGLLPNHTFKSLNLGEDHIFSLLAKASGFTLEDLSTNPGPFGCAWKGLPVSPDRLLHDKKKIIHSVKSWENMDEAAIRSHFKALRISRAA